ncbi:MAG: glutamine-hydrolyzing carbamoyl-phosphate synthase small subunit [Bacteroidia bacterium]|nr:glutamine-hydrolyzing carbamoyl-phosphate synthase small subunit [Bacteroidia bacterium]
MPEVACLYLQDGTLWRGRSVGLSGTKWGELCFNTGMTGYQEIFTDPSYAGQIVLCTHPHIGNYGTCDAEQESSKIQINGLICRSFSHNFSRIDAQKSLFQYFKDQKIIAIDEIDTRSLVRHIRNQGAMNAVISTETDNVSELAAYLSQCPAMDGLELSSAVTTSCPYTVGDETAPYHVAALDFGIKRSILTMLNMYGCRVTVFPANVSISELLIYQFDGYFLSNGPGDPAAMNYALKTVQELTKQDKPIFGICMGHQLLGLSFGLQTYKMFNGHRGLNHPVKNLQTGLSEITSQNHGFAISMDSLKKSAEVSLSHINLNDNTVEGIIIRDKPFFSVQYHPESSPGPHDSHYLFQKFVQLMAN